MTPVPRPSFKSVLLFALMALVFVALCLPFIGRLPDTWECLNFAASRNVVLSGVPSKSDEVSPDSLLLAHPPSWVYTAAASLRLLGIGFWQARVPGLAVVLLTALVLFLLARRVAADAAAWVVLAFYLTNPGTVQGALYNGYSEGTYLPLAVTLFCWAWMEFQRAAVLRRIAALSFAVAFAFWAKGTTSLALPLCLAAATFLQAPSSAVHRRFAVFAGGAGGGIGLFLLTWGAAAWAISRKTGVDFSYVFGRPLSYLVSEGGRSAQSSVGLNLWTDVPLMAARTALYTGMFLWIGALWATGGRLKRAWLDRGLAPEDMVPLCLWTVSIVFVVLHGGTGGFPKNHFAVLPLLCLSCVMALKDRFTPEVFDVREFLTVLGIGVVYYAVLVGDPVKVLNHSLRHALVQGETLRPAMLELGVRLGLYLVFPAAVLGVLKRRGGGGRAFGCLTAALLASQIGLVVAQARGDYFLAYSYGSPIGDLKDVIEIVQRETAPSDPILALQELACEADRDPVPGFGRVQWQDPEALADVLETRRPKAIVYGIPAHPLDQIQTVVKDPRLRVVMGKNYELSLVGEYRVWIRKEKEPL